MDIVLRRHRRFARLRFLGLAVAAIVLANALAFLLTGPAPSETDAQEAGPTVHFAPPSPEAAARARAVERLGRTFVFISFNTVAVSSLLFFLLARRMEARRRDRLGLPDGLDEAAFLSRATTSPIRPRAASEYRPSVN